MSLEQNINDAQRRAICHGEGPARVLAGPGSGKTFTIVRRLQYLLEELHIEPSSILVITFTKAAAGEMQERFYRLMEGKPHPVRFGTFHAVFYTILKQSNPDFSKQILSESDKFNLIEKLTIPFQKQFPGVSFPPEEELMKQIGKYKNIGEDFARLHAASDSILEEEQFQWLYAAYNRLLIQEEKLDFDDMAELCLQLFSKNPDVLSFWQKYFKYILIDEFQDINIPQYEVVKCLAGAGKNLFVVGDDDQSIYGFRGANPGIMKQFLVDYPESVCILLNTNYRSRQEIVEASGKCIAQNAERVEKEFYAARGSLKKTLREEPFSGNKTDGKFVKAVVVKKFAKKAEEQEYLTERLRAWKQNGQNYEDAAVICRTNFELEEAALLLERAGIPYRRREKRKSLFAHPIMRDLEAYIRIAAGEQSRSLLLRIINHPVRYIGRTFFTREEMGFAELKEACRCAPDKFFRVERMERDCARLASMTPFLAINYIRKGMGYDSYLKELSGENREKLQEFMELADFFQNHAREYRTGREWLQAVDQKLHEVREEPTGKKGVNLLTMHGAKGLEFPLVFIPDMNEGIIPRGRTLTKETVEEERRMFYVAMTRAMDYLELLYVTGEGERKRLPSRFLMPLLEKQSE